MEEMLTISYCNTIYSISIHGEWTDFSTPTGMLTGDHISTARSHWDYQVTSRCHTGFTTSAARVGPGP